MKISTKGRYALRMALDLAEYQKDGYISLKEIAERQQISKKYLEQIVPLLSKNGLLRTNRGNRGGYMLAKSADVLTVGEILRATEGNLAPVSCLEYPENTCPRAEECAVLPIWKGLHKVMTDYLDHITLKDILEQNHQHITGGDYCI